MKIAIFGGTFDPFHIGHLAITKAAADKFGTVYVVPTICNYYREDKRYLFTFDEKCTIIRQMICNLDNVMIDPIEKDKDSKWRTINTIEYFKKIHPEDELHFIVGEDSYKNFKTWFRYEDILNLCNLVVVQRGDEESLVKDPEIPCEELYIGKDFVESSSSKVREKLIQELMDMYLSDRIWYNF